MLVQHEQGEKAEAVGSLSVVYMKLQKGVLEGRHLEMVEGKIGFLKLR